MAGLGIRTMVWSGPRPGAPWPCSGAPAAVSLVLLTLRVQLQSGWKPGSPTNRVQTPLPTLLQTGVWPQLPGALVG